MIKLPQVTLVALGSEIYKKSQQEALDYSCKGIKFGAVKNIILPIENMDQWSHAIIYDLPKHIDTDYCILIHPDGYIVNPDSWQDEWLRYDYIGAPWPLPSDSYSYRDHLNQIIRVGNSVSFRSKRLLNLALEKNLEWKSFNGFYNEDGFICVNYRHEYIAAGMNFAPIEVAKYFSREADLPENADVDKPFAFHMHNAPDKRGRNLEYPIFEKGKVGLHKGTG